jgi:hypothetical protein
LLFTCVRKESFVILTHLMYLCVYHPVCICDFSSLLFSSPLQSLSLSYSFIFSILFFEFTIFIWRVVCCIWFWFWIDLKQPMCLLIDILMMIYFHLVVNLNIFQVKKMVRSQNKHTKHIKYNSVESRWESVLKLHTQQWDQCLCYIFVEMCLFLFFVFAIIIWKDDSQWSSRILWIIIGVVGIMLRECTFIKIWQDCYYDLFVLFFSVEWNAYCVLGL